MKKTFSTVLILSSALFLAACTQNPAAASSTTEQIESSANHSSVSSAASEDSAHSESAISDSSEASAVSHTSSSAQTTEAAEGQTASPAAPSAVSSTVSNESAQTISGSIAEALVRAYQDSGAAVSGITYQTSDSGNTVGSFLVESLGQPIAVYVTTAAAGNDPAKTFEMNTAADQAKNMAVMNEWTNNGNTVRVVRNNRANANYVEVLDRFQRSAIHIEDNLAEQLPVTLDALQSVSYPVQ